MDDDVETQQRIQVLVRLRHLASKFTAKLKELDGLRRSVEDACSEDQATTENAQSLLAALEVVSLLKQKNEDLVAAFIVKYGPEAPESAANANQAYQTALESYSRIKADTKELIYKIDDSLWPQTPPPESDVSITADVEEVEQSLVTILVFWDPLIFLQSSHVYL